MDSPHPPDPTTIGRFLIDAVKEIDRRDYQSGERVECGLVCALEQLGAQTLRETGKKYREESLIAFLLAARLQEAGLRADVEKHFLELGDPCDLMVHFPDSQCVGIEIKLAWKAWLDAEQRAQTSTAEQGHVPGGGVHTFERLEAAHWAETNGGGVLLIGFDSVVAPMDAQIDEFERREALPARGWKRTSQEAWPDGRDANFRVACWFWQREPRPA